MCIRDRPDIANDQSDLEKKSALTLKDPHKVHKNGKMEIDNHKIINMEFIIISWLEYLLTFDSILSFCFKFFPCSKKNWC